MKRTVFILLLFLFAVMLVSCSKNSTGNKTTENSNSKNQDILKTFETVCSADEALELSRKTNTVVIEDTGCTSGKDTWDSFYQAAMNGTPATVLCAHYYVLDKEHVSAELYEKEKDDYPVLFFCLIEYDGNVFSVKSRESSTAALDYQNTFQHLLHFTGESPSATALYPYYDNYVLVDDPTATMEGIWEGLFSSQYGAGYKHFIVYEDYPDQIEGDPH